MNAYYFFSEKIRTFILIVYSNKTTDKPFTIHHVKFFKNVESIQDFLELNALKLRENDQNPFLNKITKRFQQYLDSGTINLFESLKSEGVNFNFDKSFSTPFSKKVMSYLLNHLLPSETISYSGIGEAIGSRAYRAIGTILKNNNLPLIIPCHRVIKKDGSIGGFMGSKENDWQKGLKRKLLKIENYKQF